MFIHVYDNLGRVPLTNRVNIVNIKNHGVLGMPKSETGDTRTRILNAAEEIARRRGLRSLSMRAISEQIGLSAPAAYRHFRSKAEIVQAIIQRGYSRFVRGLKASRRGAREPDEVLAVTARYYLRFWIKDRAGFRILTEWARTEGSLTRSAIASGSFGDIPALVSAILGTSTSQEAERISRWVAATLYGMAFSLVQDEEIPRSLEKVLVDSAALYVVGAVRAAASGMGAVGPSKP